MVRIYKTSEPSLLGATDQYHVYNALDCCVTFEVHEVLIPKLDEITTKTYELERALQGPVLEMNLRGIRIDAQARDDIILELSEKIQFLEMALNEILVEGLGVDINPASPKQLCTLFYEVLGLPVIRSFKTKAPTVDIKALEKLKSYFYAAPIVNHILAIRDLSKQRQMLRTSIDGDGKIRTSISIAGTDTGRFASYASSFGSGTNLQTVSEKLRKVFVAEPGMKLAYIDLEQAESRAVGAIEWNLFHDGTYLDATESGDLHTSTARMCWVGLPWTGDLKKDKAIAKGIFYRDVDYRQGAKKLSHAFNYKGQPPEVAKQTGIAFDLVKDAQRAYFRAFPTHERWHEWVRQKVYKDGFITTFMGRRRHFFGRRWDADTIKAATAYEPQSAIADYLSEGILRVWKENFCQILLQVHDAILIQYPEELEDFVVPRAQKLLEIEVPLLYDRTLVIPTEAKVGWNWGPASEQNINGLKVYEGSDSRKRTAERSFLDKKFSES